MNTPINSEEFFWVNEDKKQNCFYIGLTQLGLEYCGSIQSIDIQFQQDEVFSKDEVLFIVAGDHQELEWSADFNGKITNVNHVVVEDPEVANEDPLEEGWIIAIEKEVR